MPCPHPAPRTPHPRLQTAPERGPGPRRAADLVAFAVAEDAHVLEEVEHLLAPKRVRVAREPKAKGRGSKAIVVAASTPRATARNQLQPWVRTHRQYRAMGHSGAAALGNEMTHSNEVDANACGLPKDRSRTTLVFCRGSFGRTCPCVAVVHTHGGGCNAGMSVGHCVSDKRSCCVVTRTPRFRACHANATIPQRRSDHASVQDAQPACDQRRCVRACVRACG